LGICYAEFENALCLAMELGTPKHRKTVVVYKRSFLSLIITLILPLGQGGFVTNASVKIHWPGF
jgi:hypothetical protein